MWPRPGPACWTSADVWPSVVTVNVGALPDRIAAAVGLVRAGRAGAASPGGPLSLGAYLVVTAHPDPRVARQLARGPLAAYAHFSGMPGAPVEALPAPDRAVVEAVAADYVHSGHSTRHPPDGASQGAPRHLQHLDDAFVDRFGVVGTPAQCVSRLCELAQLGLDRVLLVEGRDPAAPGEQRRAHRCLAEEVLPALHAMAA